MSNKGFTGISFPFRFDIRGGVATSTTDADDFSHIKESIMQILGTMKGERHFELKFGSEVHKVQFSNIDEKAEQEYLAFLVKEAITEQEPRVEVEDVVIEPQDLEYGYGAIVTVNFLVKKYLSYDTVSIELGGN